MPTHDTHETHIQHKDTRWHIDTNTHTHHSHTHPCAAHLPRTNIQPNTHTHTHTYTDTHLSHKCMIHMTYQTTQLHTHRHIQQCTQHATYLNMTHTISKTHWSPTTKTTKKIWSYNVSPLVTVPHIPTQQRHMEKKITTTTMHSPIHFKTHTNKKHRLNEKT